MDAIVNLQCVKQRVNVCVWVLCISFYQFVHMCCVIRSILDDNLHTSIYLLLNKINVDVASFFLFFSKWQIKFPIPVHSWRNGKNPFENEAEKKRREYYREWNCFVIGTTVGDRMSCRRDLSSLCRLSYCFIVCCPHIVSPGGIYERRSYG